MQNVCNRYALNKHDVDILSETFPELKHKLAGTLLPFSRRIALWPDTCSAIDHAEDYEKTHATTMVQVGVADAVRASKLATKVQGNTSDGKSNDPLRKVHEHLQQQDGKMVEFDGKMVLLENKVDRIHHLLEQLVAQKGDGP
jgi:hypothetical protein